MGGHPNGTSVTHATPEGIPAGDGGAPAVGWRAWRTGTRVVVRRRLPDGGLGDVLGDLLEVSDDGVVVETRRGPVRVAGVDIVLGKPVPPPPPRRPARGRLTDDGSAAGEDAAGTGDEAAGDGNDAAGTRNDAAGDGNEAAGDGPRPG